MDKKYTSFEDLMEKNRSLFRFLDGGGSSGLLRAVWNARQVEIEHLQKEKKSALERIAVLEKESIIREEHTEVLERELKQKREEEEQKREKIAKKLSLLKGEIKNLVDEKARWRENCHELEKVLAEKNSRLREQLLLCQKLERELVAARVHIRTQKSLNDQMSEELLRLTRLREGKPHESISFQS